MLKVTVGWMYPNLLNLHGERGSIQALSEIGKKMGISVEIIRIEDFDDPIPYQDLDLIVFLPGEIQTFYQLIPALRSNDLKSYLENNGYLLALGTSGLLFGKSITREDGSQLDCLGYLDMTAKERKYVWGDDLHFRMNDSKQEIIGSQIQMADVETSNPIGTVIYGMGNNNTGAEGARWRNLIYTNCLGPFLVKNPWFAEKILKDIILKKYLGLQENSRYTFASNAFDASLKFINKKTQK